MFKSNLEMCWNIKVNFADPLQYRRGPPGGHGPPVENPCLRRSCPIAQYGHLLKYATHFETRSVFDISSCLPLTHFYMQLFILTYQDQHLPNSIRDKCSSWSSCLAYFIIIYRNRNCYCWVAYVTNLKKKNHRLQNPDVWGPYVRGKTYVASASIRLWMCAATTSFRAGRETSEKKQRLGRV